MRETGSSKRSHNVYNINSFKSLLKQPPPLYILFYFNCKTGGYILKYKCIEPIVFVLSSIFVLESFSMKIKINFYLIFFIVYRVSIFL